MADCLQVCSAADVVSFIESFRKAAMQLCPDKIDLCKDAVSIPGITMTYVLNKSLEKDKTRELDVPIGLCHICRNKREQLQNCCCNGVLKCGGYCEECQIDLQAFQKCECGKAVVYELLRTGMVGGQEQVFTRYHEKDITRIRSHVYREESKLIKISKLIMQICYIFAGQVMQCPVVKKRRL